MDMACLWYLLDLYYSTFWADFGSSNFCIAFDAWWGSLMCRGEPIQENCNRFVGVKEQILQPSKTWGQESRWVLVSRQSAPVRAMFSWYFRSTPICQSCSILNYIDHSSLWDSFLLYYQILCPTRSGFCLNLQFAIATISKLWRKMWKRSWIGRKPLQSKSRFHLSLLEWFYRFADPANLAFIHLKSGQYDIFCISLTPAEWNYQEEIRW